MAYARTAVPVGYYVIEGEGGRFTPYHRVDDMMFLAGGPLAGALVPVGPSFQNYLDAARFCYDRAGVPWSSRRRVKRGAQDTTPGSGGQASSAIDGGLLPQDLQAGHQKQGKRKKGRDSQ